ncbi:ATP-dependent DNA helicase RecG [Pseudohoeflea coraliihabitans]|uniref:ATP-dependent DNA helicase RecG n=1 Tax=Pseudohoeflea coraliihabitans TaxID=2860393 RepID=A0ABS6WR20_9HYPH|nr:ATP-dependent DNA helicase RecG [Pseudohoeflea sp. DP4N28-3]MBW3098417.1 ATP-dependent DNA helicase RecG [Pseudohoeflea sp. DP4N28-3]
MRPHQLDSLFRPVDTLSGIGPKLAEALARVTGRDGPEDTRVIDLLLLAPYTLIDRSHNPGVAHAPEGTIVTLSLTIDRHQPAPRGRGNVPYRVHAHDETGEISLVFFKAQQKWLEKLLPVGETVFVSGKVDWYNGRPSMVHPDHIVGADDKDELPLVEPVYPLTAGLSAKMLRKAIDAALTQLPVLPEWADPQFIAKAALPRFGDAVMRLHHPEEPGDFEPQDASRRRLAYDELLAGQISLSLVRGRLRKLPGQAIAAKGLLREKIRGALPYGLTGSQTEAIDQVLADMRLDARMIRLLQGDVGSGKTIVALLTMADAVEAGGQAVLMAPTEILARQHHATLKDLAAAAGIRVDLLTGRSKGRERTATLERIASGEAQIIVGTHALFQDTVVFHRLTYAVVDEQHRFGVHQRLRLTAKGQAPHMLVMTATPIPRTLVLAAFGDMDVSQLTEKPAGRKPITTVTVPDERLGDVVERLRAALDGDRKIYWICPLVEDSDKSDLMSAESRFEGLKKALGPGHAARLDVVHGRMSGEDKDRAMERFKRGDTRLLVATTVIEVGVDVPDATIMVIEHAERFGLAQIHQLRGRVGRGTEASSCILLYHGPLSETAHARLAVLRDSEDGFRIAEEDLRLRGEGDLLGTQQSGLPGFRLANLAAHADLLEVARSDARNVIAADPDLSGPRGPALRMLLYLMRRDEAIRFLRAG